jgi:hypothetical protein
MPITLPPFRLNSRGVNSRDWDDRRDPARLHNTKSPEYRLNPESDPEQWRGNEPAPATVPLRGR